MNQANRATDASAPTFEARQVIHFTDKTFGPCASSARLGEPPPEAEEGATDIRRCFGVYRNDVGGAQTHLGDFSTQAEAEESARAAKVQETMEAWEKTHAEVANALYHFLRNHGAVFESAIKRYGDAEAEDDLRELREMVEERAVKQEAFLRAVEGK